VASPGLRWIVLARLEQLRAARAVRETLERMFPRARLDAFERMTAIELRRVKHAVVAGYDRSTLYAVDGVADALEAERRYRDRMVFETARAVHRDDAVLVTGLSGGRSRRALVALAPGVVVIESGDDRHAKAALLYALGKMRRSPPALREEQIAALASRLGEAPLLAFAPGPFEGEYERALRGLMAAATAAGAAARLTPVGSLQVALVVAGAWGSSAQAAAERLRQGWDDLADSPLGRVLGLAEPLAPPLSTHAPDAVSLTVELDAERVLGGLSASVSGRVSDMMR
jgi:hypothetical protein